MARTYVVFSSPTDLAIRTDLYGVVRAGSEASCAPKPHKIARLYGWKRQSDRRFTWTSGSLHPWLDGDVWLTGTATLADRQRYDRHHYQNDQKEKFVKHPFALFLMRSRDQSQRDTGKDRRNTHAT